MSQVLLYGFECLQVCLLLLTFVGGGSAAVVPAATTTLPFGGFFLHKVCSATNALLGDLQGQALTHPGACDC